ncbi:MAG: Coenzyme F420 hydrogenase/dehydrogenase, beta subunit C-terminal domain, partial [Deltaproteobacteria bacterium]|nr:Coenzyme F420 hydrogenase/dehydrogenase, beta subunit C-terminal domain [Deltaproteobacteria bacterium]
DDGLCHRCGSCVGICPTSVLGLDSEDYPIVENLSACTDCDWCVKVCPGDELDVHAINRDMFGVPQDLRDVHGVFEKAYLSYSMEKDLRWNSSSGGAVTGLLLSLLERGEIDGAVVISADESTPWKGKPIIARTREELLSATKSKYAISPTNAVFAELRELSGRYGLVGLPCQIHGFHKAVRLDRRLRERVVVTIGLFCHAATEHNPLRIIWDDLERRGKKPVRYIPRVGKHPGEPVVVFEDGTQEPVYFPTKAYRPSSTEMLNLLYRLYTPERCMTCYDSTSEFADIAVGDPWMPPPADDINFREGYSFVMARTPEAVRMLEGARDAGDLKLLELARDAAKHCNLETALEKRYRAFRVIETRRRQGHGVPDYGIQIPHPSGMRFLRVEMNMLTHILCYVPRFRDQFLRFLFSPVGYALIWLNHQRRVLRITVRDGIAKVKRKLSGRDGLRSE